MRIIIKLEKFSKSVDLSKKEQKLINQIFFFDVLLVLSSWFYDLNQHLSTVKHYIH